MQRSLLRPLPCAIIVLVLTAGYLAGPARDMMDVPTACAVLIHVVLGTLLIAPVGWALVGALRRAAGRHLRVLLLSLTLIACLCALSGVYLTVRAGSGHSTAHDTIPSMLHNLAGATAVVLAVFVWWQKRLREARTHDTGTANAEPASDASPGASGPSAVPGHTIRSAADRRRATCLEPGAGARLPAGRRMTAAIAPTAERPAAEHRNGAFAPIVEANQAAGRNGRLTVAAMVPAACLLLSLTQGALFGAAALLPVYNADEYYRDLTATTAEQAQNPFFPAGVRLKSARSLKDSRSAIDHIPDSGTCGVVGCHPQSYAEWAVSAHHLAGTDPFYRASLAAEIGKVGADTSLWCQGCHAPVAALRFAGADSTHAAEASSETEGVGCYACHAVAAAPPRTGNGRFVLSRPQDYPFAKGRGWQQALHAFLLRVRPGPHQRAFLKPALHRSAEFCSSCHRQSMTVAQNHYQFVRGPDEYGEWTRGPAAGRTARASGVGAPETCQDCHFHDSAEAGFAGRVTHSAPGGNTALADLTRSSAPVAATMRRNGSIGLDLFALRPAGPSPRDEPWIAPLDRPRTGYSLRPGTVWWLDVVVRNRGVGHTFPAGYSDLTQAWLEVTVSDGARRTIASNGVLADPGDDVPRDAHVYGSLGLDRTGSAILRHTQTQQVTTAYQRAIPAGGSDIARFRLQIPAAKGTRSRLGALRIHVRLRYRSVRPDFARWALATASSDATEAIGRYAPPVSTLAETDLLIPLERAAAPMDASGDVHSEDAVRFEAYGKGLLAPVDKPDIHGAVRAFYAAGERAPGRPDPWLGLGRAYLREPDLRLAAVNFERALRCSPGHPAAVSELSVVYNRQGQPERAIQALTPLVATFPDDGDLRYDLGLAFFRAGRYPDAADSFRRALAIDPDQYAAHFELKRCYELLRRTAEARLEDSVTRYMGEDRAAARLVPSFLGAHPEAAYRAEPFPVHPLK